MNPKRQHPLNLVAGRQRVPESLGFRGLLHPRQANMECNHAAVRSGSMVLAWCLRVDPTSLSEKSM